MSHGTESWLKQQDQSASQPGLWDLLPDPSAPAAGIWLSFLCSNNFTVSPDWSGSTVNAIYVSGTIYTFWNTLAAHVFCDYPINHCKMGERLLHWREEQNTAGQPPLPGIQVQLLRIMYKWLFFNLEHVKSKFLPTSCPRLWINFLSFAVLFCNFWQRSNVFGMPRVL